jgi:hypothetical protein
MFLCQLGLCPQGFNKQAKLNQILDAQTVAQIKELQDVVL